MWFSFSLHLKRKKKKGKDKYILWRKVESIVKTRGIEVYQAF